MLTKVIAKRWTGSPSAPVRGTGSPSTGWTIAETAMHYLSPRDLVSIAERETGEGLPLDDASLDAVAAHPASADGTRDLFPGVQVKAAALMTELLHRRPFPHGNERIALLAVIVFLNLNGFDVEASESDLAELADLAAQGNLSLMMVATALEAITVRLRILDVDAADPSAVD